MRTVAVQDLLDECAFRLHVPAFGTGEFVTLEDALRVLRGACGRLSTLLGSVFGSELFVRDSAATVQAELDAASLPQDFSSLRTIHLSLNGTRYELQREHPAGEATSTGAAEVNTDPRAWTGYDLPRYWLEDQTIRFSFPPTEEMSLYLTYVGDGLTFVDEDSTLVLGAGWDEWLVNDVCEKVSVREQKDASEFVRMRSETTQLIMKAATKRDRSAPVVVRDVRPRAARGVWWQNRGRW